MYPEVIVFRSSDVSLRFCSYIWELFKVWACWLSCLEIWIYKAVNIQTWLNNFSLLSCIIHNMNGKTDDNTRWTLFLPKWQLVMYVCLYRGRPSWRSSWDWAFQLGQRGGTNRNRGSNVLTQRYHRYRVTLAGSYLRTQCALSEPTLRQLKLVRCRYKGSGSTESTLKFIH